MAATRDPQSNYAIGGSSSGAIYPYATPQTIPPSTIPNQVWTQIPPTQAPIVSNETYLLQQIDAKLNALVDLMTDLIKILAENG